MTILATLERYYDGVPRDGADAEEVGPFTLFRSRLPWPYYARPRLGLHHQVTVDDVRRLLARQDALDLPRTIEWVDETTPSLLPAARAAGLEPELLPLLVLDDLVDAPAPPGVEIRVLDAGDPDLPPAVAVAHVGFGHSGTAVGRAGVSERDARVADPAAEPSVDAVRDLLRRGASHLAAAVDRTGDLGGGVVASGSANVQDDTSEVVGVATLPAARRRGIAGALTAELVRAVGRLGIRTVFLSAGSDDVARVYRRIGFRDVGTACIVE